jgi:hypothetical protein
MLEFIPREVLCKSIGWYVVSWHIDYLESTFLVFLSKLYVVDIDMP